MISDIMINVVMPSVVAPQRVNFKKRKKQGEIFCFFLFFCLCLFFVCQTIKCYFLIVSHFKILKFQAIFATVEMEKCLNNKTGKIVLCASVGCRAFQRYDTWKNNNACRNCSQHCDTQYNDTQHSTQYNDIAAPNMLFQGILKGGVSLYH
jgi:hypothetical protein